MLKRFILYAGLLFGLSAAACSDRAADLVAPFRQNALAAGDSIFIQSGDAQVGRANTRLAKGLQVIVRNNGAPVADARGTFTVTAGGGTVSRTAFRTNASGIAQFSWTLGASGPQQVTASLNGGNSAIFSATVIPVGSTLTILLGDGQTALPGDTLAGNLIVELRDPLGAAIPGANVRFTTVPAHGGAAKFASRTTNTAGRALNRWMLGWGASAQTLKAFVPGVDTVTFNATASTAGISFQIVNGDGQNANIGATLPNLLVVQLRKNGVPVEGVKGQFDVVSGSGAVNRNTFTTNSLGRGTVSWTLGATASVQQMTASIGAIGALTFSATANMGTFFTNLTHSETPVMSRGFEHERQIQVGFTVNTSVPFSSVYVRVNGGAAGSPSCSAPYVSATFTGSCTITVPHGFTGGVYSLSFYGFNGSNLGETTLAGAVTVDDTNPLSIDTVSLSHNTVDKSEPATHNVVAREVASSSKGVTYMEVNIKASGTEGPWLAGGCVALNNVITPLPGSRVGTCTLAVGYYQGPGLYDIRYTAMDAAGNIVNYTVNGSVNVVP
jgi:hypothetical protein